MPSFTSQADVTRWLEKKPNDAAIVLAARAATRVIPVFATQSAFSDSPLGQVQSEIILRTFRCAATAWAFAAYPGNADKLASAAIDAASLTDDRYGYKGEIAASRAAAAAGASADYVRRFASHSVMYAVLAADDVSPQAAADILNSCAADADLLEQGYSAPTLALSSKLWSSTPEWAFGGWAALKHALLSAHQDWEAWTDWYEERQKVGESDQANEVARVTIPDGTWDLGAERVNAIIKRWFEERGIWRHEKVPEPDHSHLISETGTSEANNEYDIEARLTALSPEKLRVIGVRVALRAIPLLALSPLLPDNPDFADACLAAFSGAAKAWYASKYPAHRDIGASGSAAFPSGNYEHDFGILIAGTIVSATHLGTTPWGLAVGINRIRMIAQSAEGPAAATVLDVAFSDDLLDLNNASASAVASTPLWPGGSPPRWMISRWEQLRRTLIQTRVGWEAWVDWYWDRLHGDIRSDAWEVAYVQVPEEFWADGPAEVNKWLNEYLDVLKNISPEKIIPEIPTPGPGPRFQVSNGGPIERASTYGFDESGNDSRTIGQLKPLVQKCVADLRARVSRNEFPELLGTIEQYDEALNPGSDRGIEWGEIWGLGVLLQNSASAAERKIAQRILPALEDPVKATLDSLLALHGPLILATNEGSRLSALSQEFAMTRQQQKNLREVSEQIVEQLSRNSEVITPAAAKSVANAIHAIDEGGHPERGAVYALATIKNVSIILVGAAAASTPAVIGALFGSTLWGAVLGSPITLIAVETVKKNPAFNALVTQLGIQLDGMSDLELRNWLEESGRRFAPFRSFVISNQEPLKKIAESSKELKWMLRYIDFVTGKKN